MLAPAGTTVREAWNLRRRDVDAAPRVASVASPRAEEVRAVVSAVLGRDHKAHQQVLARQQRVGLLAKPAVPLAKKRPHGTD